ncbi:YbjQ family protein [Bacillus sp. 165]|uniref:YbjQ family protein n=1 Tax=Bacillus sp. 165 TaxID=1529117 RepID=UPI001ADB5949|nr:YbjQ family protein [Bacillus sp. 165]MBO9129768.1 YbjQ family protein [Bacillus sp. 165]
MIIVTTDNLTGKNITEVKGYVSGQVVQSRNIGRDIMAGLKSVIGGELKGYTEMIRDAEKMAITRMVEEAEKKGANAIIGMRLQSSAGQGTFEIIAYGTAVRGE